LYIQMLKYMKYSGFNWDKGNIEKCKKHGLSIKKIESFFYKNNLYISPDIKHSRDEKRFVAIGEINKKRYAFVVFTFRNIKNKKLIRPISARYMHEKEKIKYEKFTK
jgi:uncharacterized DUF497 family protein